MPKWVKPVILVIVFLSFVPLSLLYVQRASRTTETRTSIIPDMDDQQFFKSQTANAMFADGRAMRPQVEGTIAQGQLTEDEHFFYGLVDGRPATVFPNYIPTSDSGEPLPLLIDDTLIERGQDRFNINCSPCHGFGGFGDGTVARRLDAMQEDPTADPIARASTWVPPSNLHDAEIRNRQVGHIYNTITNGIRTMPAYGPHLEPIDRWAVVAYVRALQLSQGAGMDDVPTEYKGNLEMRVKPSERTGDADPNESSGEVQ